LDRLQETELSEPSIVDTHTHVVSPDHDRYPLNPRELSGQWYLDGPASAEDLAQAMSETGVSQAVLVQGVGAYTYDNRYAADSAAADPEHFVSACCIDVEADDARERLRYWIEERGMAGIRLFALSRKGPSWLIDARTYPVWALATELGAHVIVTILPHQLDELERVLGHFPEVPVSLDHCGFALGEPRSRTQLLELSAHPNLHLKVSTHNLDEAIQKEGSAQPMVRSLVDQFGAKRVMWGSDYCQTHDRPYAALVTLARESFGGLSAAEREQCLSGTARTLWPGLSPATAPR
jgi:predicted TIM-barrel fold metal-dependent hydrolase